MTTPVTCRRCSRPLRDPARIAQGIGRACQIKERDAAIELAIIPWSDRQKADAKALIKVGKLKPMPREGMYRITSRDGKRTYFACSLACPCLARGRCIHMCAAAIADAWIAFAEARGEVA